MQSWSRSLPVGMMALGLTLSWAMPVQAQRVRVKDAWQQVYAQLPTLPKENQYVSIETKRPDTQNTFVGRLISYHLYVKGRPRSLRLDWKHTIADYLGANESIDEVQYPTQKRLRGNPLERDRAILQAMTRRQRNQLVKVLVDVFRPRSFRTRTKPTVPVVRPQPQVPLPMFPTPPKTAPLPGGADFLK